MSDPSKPQSRRDISPPNSVKAFAQLKRRDTTGASTTKSRSHDPIHLETGDTTYTNLTSIRSRASKKSFGQSHRDANDAPETTVNELDSVDVCIDYRGSESSPKPQERLHIDFYYLEQFIVEDERNASMLRKNEAFAPDVRKTPTIDRRPKTRVDTATSEKEKLPMLEFEQTFEPTQSDRFTFFSSAFEETLSASRLGELISPNQTLKDLFLPPAVDETDESVWWLDVNSPSEEEIRSICKAFGIHPLTIEDIENRESREKIDLFPTYYFASIRSFSMIWEEGADEEELDAFSVYVIVFRGGCLSFSFAENTHAAEVRQRYDALREHVTLSSDWICYALIDNIVDHFAHPLHQISTSTDSLDDQVFQARSTDIPTFLRRMGSLRKSITTAMRLLGGKAHVLRGFTKRFATPTYPLPTPTIDIALYLGDIQDHVVTMLSNLHHFEKMLARSHAMFLAQISIDNIIQTRKSNRTLSIITVVATVLVPCVMVAGLFGMNVPVPWNASDDGGGPDDNTHAFFGILGFLVFAVLVCLAVAKRARWI